MTRTPFGMNRWKITWNTFGPLIELSLRYGAVYASIRFQANWEQRWLKDNLYVPKIKNIRFEMLES